MSNVGQLQGFQVRFAQNPRWPSIHKYLNDHYGVTIAADDSFYEDATRNAFRDDVCDRLRNAIVDWAILPQAVETNDRGAIARIINSATILVGYGPNRGNGTAAKVRFERNALTTYAQREIAATRFTLELIIGTGRIFTTDPEPSFLDWSVFEVDPTGVRPLDAPGQQNAPQSQHTNTPNCPY